MLNTLHFSAFKQCIFVGRIFLKLAGIFSPVQNRFFFISGSKQYVKGKGKVIPITGLCGPEVE